MIHDETSFHFALHFSFFLSYVQSSKSSMSFQRHLICRFCIIPYIFSSSLFLLLLLLQFPSASSSSATVTLDSIEILKTHKWLPSKSEVYFQCSGGNKTIFPDVQIFNVSYTFNGQESWQPLVEFTDTKCKRCGFYEKGLVSDNVMDEWEFCPSDFTQPNPKYVHFKDKQLNATFLCPDCIPPPPPPPPPPLLPPIQEEEEEVAEKKGGGEGELKGRQLAMVIVIFVLVSIIVFIIGLLAGIHYWHKRKREQDKARFTRLFEEEDEFDRELGLGPLQSFN